jgi:hypothetical protein
LIPAGARRKKRRGPPGKPGPNGIFEVLTMDLWMVLGTIVFFLVAIGYTVACDKLK